MFLYIKKMLKSYKFVVFVAIGFFCWLLYPTIINEIRYYQIHDRHDYKDPIFYKKNVLYLKLDDRHAFKGGFSFYKKANGLVYISPDNYYFDIRVLDGNKILKPEGNISIRLVLEKDLFLKNEDCDKLALFRPYNDKEVVSFSKDTRGNSYIDFNFALPLKTQEQELLMFYGCGNRVFNVEVQGVLKNCPEGADVLFRGGNL